MVALPKLLSAADAFCLGLGLMVSPPALTSSPRKVLVEEPKPETTEEDEKIKEREMNVDQSINSAVINGLFEGILEQSGDAEDHVQEEEDALNISSMSLLTPLAETIAAVVKSPERKMMVGARRFLLQQAFLLWLSATWCVSTDFHSSQLLPHQEQHPREHLLSRQPAEHQHPALRLLRLHRHHRGRAQAAVQVSLS